MSPFHPLAIACAEWCAPFFPTQGFEGTPFAPAMGFGGLHWPHLTCAANDESPTTKGKTP